MKAVYCLRYGPPEVLKLVEAPKPAPGRSDLLIRIHATTVAAGDTRVRSCNVPALEWIPARLFLGITRPRRKILGMELSGVVESIGPDVTRFKDGDQVFAFAGFGFGAYAEYICLPENGQAPTQGLIARKPVNMTYEQAAAIPLGGLAALNILRLGGIGKGKKVLIYGASGSVGTFAVQISVHFGAEVTAVCGPSNIELVKSLGASIVIDYTRHDFSQSAERYDLIFDAVDKIPRAKRKVALAFNGVFVHAGMARQDRAEDLTCLKELAEAGKIRAVIDRTYTLERIAEAHAYVDMGHKRGNVAITVTGEAR